MWCRCLGSAYSFFRAILTSFLPALPMAQRPISAQPGAVGPCPSNATRELVSSPVLCWSQQAHGTSWFDLRPNPSVALFWWSLGCHQTLFLSPIRSCSPCSDGIGWCSVCEGTNFACECLCAPWCVTPGFSSLVEQLLLFPDAFEFGIPVLVPFILPVWGLYGGFSHNLL